MESERRVNAGTEKQSTATEGKHHLYNPARYLTRASCWQAQPNTNLERLGDLAEGIAWAPNF